MEKILRAVIQLVLIVQKFKESHSVSSAAANQLKKTSGDKRKMSKKQSDHLEFTRGDILGVDRSHTSALPMQN